VQVEAGASIVNEVAMELSPAVVEVLRGAQDLLRTAAAEEEVQVVDKQMKTVFLRLPAAVEACSLAQIRMMMVLEQASVEAS
jgi:hypothetical protein